MYARLRRSAGVALLAAGCAPFKGGSGADASDDDAGEQMGDMQVRADMDADATRHDATPAFDASGDAAASSYIYSRAEAPFPSSVDPASDASEYVRLVLYGRNRCYGISMTTDSDFATTVRYEVPSDARIAAATFTDGTTEPMTMECVPGTAPRASSDGVGFAAVVSGTCPIGDPDCATALVRWVSTTTPICSAPPCFATGSTWLVVGWVESSALRACLGNSSPDFGLDSEDACPREGASIDAINAVPDCP